MDEEAHTHPHEEELPPSTPTDGNAQDVQCVFMVVVARDGGSIVVIDPQVRFNAARMATPADVYPALANAMADWEAMKTAQAVVTFQQQLAQQAMAQAQAETIRQRIQGPGGGLTFPPR